ncbi:hypothetical protein AB0I98_36900 [Streptomyces sp. NPDC050211]|uniref:hypothetical protein n=1 Tax=Streptomyces sp. NPDC050211 TaxID=3154932 RepID=UPI003427C244
MIAKAHRSEAAFKIRALITSGDTDCYKQLQPPASTLASYSTSRNTSSPPDPDLHFRGSAPNKNSGAVERSGMIAR